jgi:DNA-binding NtrC family response regulator
MALPKALVACSECGHRQVLANLVARCGLKPVIATSSSDAILMPSSKSVSVVFCQDDLPGDGFKAVLKAAEQVAVPVVVSSPLADSQRYLESMQFGAFDFICLPYHYPEVASLTMAMLRRSPSQAAIQTP